MVSLRESKNRKKIEKTFFRKMRKIVKNESKCEKTLKYDIYKKLKKKDIFCKKKKKQLKNKGEKMNNIH